MFRPCLTTSDLFPSKFCTCCCLRLEHSGPGFSHGLTPCHSGFGSNVTSEESSCTIYSGFYYRIFQTMSCPKLTSWVSTNIFPFRSPGTEENNPRFSSFSHFIATGFLEFPSQMYKRAKWQGRGEQPTEWRLSKMIKTCYQKEH